MPDVRQPAVAGAFYPAGRDELAAEIRRCDMHEYGPSGGKAEYDGKAEQVLGAVFPHAGYRYSGPVACHSARAVAEEQARRRRRERAPAASAEGGGGNAPPPLYVMAGPNHRGTGAPAATMRDCVWRTPLGDVPVDSRAASVLESEAGGLARPDHAAHAAEHSLEVVVPFLQEIAGPRMSILPVVMSDQSKEAAVRLGHAMARAAVSGAAEEEGAGPAPVIASSDLTHYEPNAAAHEKDGELIGAIEGMDVDRFYRVLEDRRVSACGYGAMAAAMVACGDLGAARGRLLRYATSYDVAGADESSVVGYASVVFCR